MLQYSIAELVDKLVVTHLKYWHLEEKIEELRLADAPAEEVDPVLEQAISLNKLRVEICESIEEIIAKISSEDD